MPALVQAYRLGLFGRAHWTRNLLSGLVVGVVALPLGMAFAIASGAKPEQGLYTAIVAGIVTAVFGGSLVQISGPTGAFIVILSSITAQYGYAGLQLAGLMAGVLLVVLGVARMGTIIKFIPYPVTTGFTGGIAIVIWVGQWKDFFGLQPGPLGEHFHEKLWQLLRAFAHVDLTTTLLSLFALALVVLTPRVAPRLPGPLVAMVGATVAQAVFQFEGVATIGSVFGGIPRELPEFTLPSASWDHLVELVGPAFAIAMLCAIESLLSAVVADGMAGTHHDSNQELIGQGLANIASPLFGGFAATGAIARTATNVKNGGNSPLAGLVHSATLIVIMLLLAPYASAIPLGALAAILFVVAYNMSEAKHFLHLVRTGPRSDVAVMLTTFGLTVLIDLVMAVNVGVVLAALLFMRRMANTVRVGVDEAGDDDANGRRLPKGVSVYSIDGPFFFGAAETFERTMASLHAEVKTLIIRLDHVPFIDATAMHAFAQMLELFRKRGTRVVLCGALPLVSERLAQAGIVESLGAGNFYATYEEALRSFEPPRGE